MIDIQKFNLTLEDQERTLKIIRRHWIFGVLYFFIGVLSLGIIPIALVVYYQNFNLANLEFFTIPDFVAVIFLSIYLLMVSLILFISWMDYSLDIGIITNVRIIDVDQDGIFSRKMSQVYLNNIEDVSGNQKGFFAHIFNYGDILVQSAATKGLFNWQNIPDPFFVAEYILDLHREAVQKDKNKKSQ
ncbi:MAG: hypothetical protein Fur0024_3410 [Patescibacteria group bacterium]